MLVESQNSLLKLGLVVRLSVLVLRLERVSRVSISLHLPVVQAIDLVQGDAERSVFLPQQLNRFESLVFETVHDVNDKDSQVTK